MPIAAGSARPGLRASPPAWAIEPSERCVNHLGNLGAGCLERPQVIVLIEREAGDDHDAAEQKHHDHQRHQCALIELHAANVDCDEEPEEQERQPNSNRAGLQRAGNSVVADGGRDVAQKRDHHVGHHADNDREAEPLREAGDETEVGIQSATHVDVTAASARHRRGQDRVGEGRKHRRDGAYQERRQHPRSDVGHVALQHERHDVDARTEHRADAGGRQPEQAEFTDQSRGLIASFARSLHARDYRRRHLHTLPAAAAGSPGHASIRSKRSAPTSSRPQTSKGRAPATRCRSTLADSRKAPR